jgi:DNA-binding MarR family transcriptional regulator
VTTPQERSRFRRQIAERSGVEINPGAIWALVRIDEYGFARARALAEEEGVDPARVSEVLTELRQQGLIADEDGRRLTSAGREQTQRIVSARWDLFAEALADGTADRHPEVAELLQQLARELCGEPPRRASGPALPRSSLSQSS